MKKKGFTLVELLGVVFILALLGLIIVPITSNILREKKQDLYNVQIQHIKDGAESYVAEHVFEISIPSGTSRGITLGTLQSLGYVNEGIINPLTRQAFSSDLVVIISNTSSGFTYTVCTSDVTCESVVML